MICIPGIDRTAVQCLPSYTDYTMLIDMIVEQIVEAEAVMVATEAVASEAAEASVAEIAAAALEVVEEDLVAAATKWEEG